MNKFDLFKETLIFMGARSHMWHLTATSYSQHITLGEFYEEISDLTDAFVEGCTHYHGLVTPTGTGYSFETAERATEVLVNFLNLAKTVHTNLGDFPGLTNILEDIMSLTESTLYKLRFLP